MFKRNRTEFLDGLQSVLNNFKKQINNARIWHKEEKA